MDTYHTVLYLHLLSMLVGFAAASIITLCLIRLRAAETVAEAVPWGMLAGKIGMVFPLVLVGFFATGAYMTNEVWMWDTGWVDVGIVSLTIIAIQGLLVAKGRAKVLQKALRENGPGPLGEPARRRTHDSALWVTSFSNPGLLLGVAWVMTQKPSTTGAIAGVVVAYAIGAGVALLFAKTNPP
ncbi:MAG TPA: hypothetical protein VF877_10870 [Gaiellaceae bacterium]